jgi:hypothetical protein
MPLGVSSVLFLYGAFTLLTPRYGIEYGEGIVLWQAVHISSPAEAYHPIAQYPYVVFHYPPFFHLISRLAGALVGDLLIGGRLVTLVSTIGIMMVLGLLVFRHRGAAVDQQARWIGALAAATLPTTVNSLREWVPVMRVDMLGLFLSLSGVWLFVEGSRHRILRYGAVVCFVAAVFTKHTLLAAPLACVLTAALEDRKQAMWLSALGAVLGVAVFGVLQWATNGQFFVHLFVHNQNAFSLAHGVEMHLANLSHAWPVLVLAVVTPPLLFTAPASAATSEPRDVTVRCLSIYLALAFLVSWTSGKFGSWQNYFFEVDLICCAFAGLGISSAWSLLRRRAALVQAAMALFVLVAISWKLPSYANTVLQLTEGSRSLAASRLAETSQAVALVQSVPGPVFSWDLMALMLAHKDIPLEPAIMFDLAKSGKWDMSPFLDQIRAGRYDLIVTNSYTEWLPSDAVTRAMAGTYGLAEQFGTYHVYRPVGR